MLYSPRPHQQLRFIRCTIADKTYCLRMTLSCGIRRIEELQIKTDDSGAVGWISGEQDRLLVFHLATLMHQPYYEVNIYTGKILIINSHPHPWGILVDRVEDIIQVDANDVYPMPPIIGRRATKWFEGIVKYYGEMLPALSPRGLRPDAASASWDVLSFVQTYDEMYSIAGFPAITKAQRKVVLFSVLPDETIVFGLSLIQISQILQPLPLFPVSGADSHILGLAEWRGVPLVVIDLSRFMGAAQACGDSNQRWLIIRVPSHHICVGLTVRPQVSIQTLPIAYHVSDRIISLKETLIRGKFELPFTTLVIPDVDRIFVSNYDRAA